MYAQGTRPVSLQRWHYPWRHDCTYCVTRGPAVKKSRKYRELYSNSCKTVRNMRQKRDVILRMQLFSQVLCLNVASAHGRSRQNKLLWAHKVISEFSVHWQDICNTIVVISRQCPTYVASLTELMVLACARHQAVWSTTCCTCSFSSELCTLNCCLHVCRYFKMLIFLSIYVQTQHVHRNENSIMTGVF